MKILISLIILFYSNFSFSYEIIRDPIFENYFHKLQLKYDTPKSKVYLIESNELNAFVIDDSIYFTTEIIKNIKFENVLKSIFFHELGHVFYNHYGSKKINIKNNEKKKLFNNLFSIGAAIFSGNANIGLATNLTIDQKILRDLSTNSIRYEIQADSYMLKMIKKHKINTKQLIKFFDKLPDNSNNFFKSHPNHADRIISLKEFENNKDVDNSIEFEWIKAKYSQNSQVKEFNEFFKNLEMGKVSKNNLYSILDDNLINYEIYKSGIRINNIYEMYQYLTTVNANSYLKIEFFNYAIDNDLNNIFQIIEINKNNQDIHNEYFFYFLYGKYYNKILNDNLSNFYFCQFYTLINITDKSSYFCKKYDIKNIPEIDKSYALFK